MTLKDKLRVFQEYNNLPPIHIAEDDDYQLFRIVNEAMEERLDSLLQELLDFLTTETDISATSQITLTILNDDKYTWTAESDEVVGDMPQLKQQIILQQLDIEEAVEQQRMKVCKHLSWMTKLKDPSKLLEAVTTLRERLLRGDMELIALSELEAEEI